MQQVGLPHLGRSGLPPQSQTPGTSPAGDEGATFLRTVFLRPENDVRTGSVAGGEASGTSPIPAVAMAGAAGRGFRGHAAPDLACRRSNAAFLSNFSAEQK